MRPTVEAQLRTRGVEEKDFSRFINYELLPFARQARQGLNYIARVRATIPTDGTGTSATLWASQDIASGTAVMFEARVNAWSSGNWSSFIIAALFRNNGTLTQEGLTTQVYAQNASGVTVDFSVVFNHIELIVDDVGVAAFNWVAVIDALEAP